MSDIIKFPGMRDIPRTDRKAVKRSILGMKVLSDDLQPVRYDMSAAIATLRSVEALIRESNTDIGTKLTNSFVEFMDQKGLAATVTWLECAISAAEERRKKEGYK